MKRFLWVRMDLGNDVYSLSSEAIHQRGHAFTRYLKIIYCHMLDRSVYVNYPLNFGCLATKPKQNGFPQTGTTQQSKGFSDCRTGYLYRNNVHLCRPLHTCQSWVNIPPSVNLLLPLTVSQASVVWLGCEWYSRAPFMHTKGLPVDGCGELLNTPAGSRSMV